MRKMLLGAALLALLAGCGTRGGLTLPPPAEKKAAATATTPAFLAFNHSSKPVAEPLR